MSKAYYKDIQRSIKKGWKRFLSILIITVLGVGMMSGLYAACLDMYYSADDFFDRQNLFDIQILSTLGLTQEDVDAIAKLEEVEIAEGGYSETVYTDVDDIRKDAQMTVLSGKGVNMPYLLAGRMPIKEGEIAVIQKYLDESGNSIGDILTIEENIEDTPSDNNEKTMNTSQVDTSMEYNGGKDNNSDGDTTLDMEIELEEETNEPTFSNTAYTITGVVLDPKDIQSNNSTVNMFRSSVNTDYTFFITEADASSDIFTVVYVILNGTREMNGYSQEYNDRVQSFITNIERDIKAQREQARYDSVMMEAHSKVADARITMNEKFAEADEKFANGWQDIDEAKEELTDGEVTLLREKQDAEKKIGEARDEIKSGKQKLTESEKQLEEGKAQLAKGEAELTEAERKLAESETELEEGEKQLIEGETQLAQGEAQLNENAQKLTKGKQQLIKERQKTEEEFADAKEQIYEAQKELDAARSHLEEGIVGLKSAFGSAWPADEWDALVNAVAALAAIGEDDNGIATGTVAERTALESAIKNQGEQLQPMSEACVQTAQGLGKVNGGQRVLDVQKSAFEEQKKNALLQFTEAEAELTQGEAQLEAARQMFISKRRELETAKITLTKGRAELEAAKTQLSEGRAELEAAKRDWEKGRTELLEGKTDLTLGEAKLIEEETKAKGKIEDAYKELLEGKEELAEEEAKLREQEQKYAEKKEEAKEKLADAYAKLEDIDMARWYIQDRTYLESYSSLNSDLSSIETIGHVFPIIFLFVAILMSLTTMTRMVEEERSLIGTYKALGYGNAAVYRKYLIFAFLACLLGGILGDIFGFIFMPKFISVILKELYTVPHYYLRFDTLYGVGGVVLFMVSIIGATVLACRNELRQMPAVLLRPKAPRAGSRVFLERISPVWSRLKFLSKVTVRNLFRYKKRLFMTVGGITGCTALILCGFAIRDSVFDLALKQYDKVYQYDLMAVFEEDDNGKMTEQLDADSNVKEYLNLRIESVKLINANGEAEKVQLMVIPDGGRIEDYIRLKNLDGTLAHLDDNGVIITQNAIRMLGLKTGKTVFLQNMELVQQEATVSGVVRNYLGNNVYMTEKLYESLFGTYVPNGVLAYLSEDCADEAAYAETLLNNDSVLSTSSITALREDFEFDLINAVVLLLIVMAGGLAFVVLFTLSNTNISERARELATIKVLGFYDKEVYQYVNKETLCLTGTGILIGLPVGRMLSGLLTIVLNMPSIHFAVHVEPVSYLISAAITFCFTIIVNWITNRSLDRINMVEALKSVE